MLTEDDDQLLWLPSSSTTRSQASRNLRSSVSSVSSVKGCTNFSRSSRLSSIFSNESNVDDDDDTFGLKKLNNNNTTQGSRSTTASTGSNKVALLVQIDTDSPSSFRDRSDLGARLQMAMQSLRDDPSNEEGDSLLSFKLNESDPTNLSLEATSVTPDNDLNIAFTDWDRLKDEATAIAGDIKQKKMFGTPKTPKATKLLSSEKKKFDLSSFSPGVLVNSPLVPLNESGDLNFRLVDLSPNLPPAKILNFGNTTERLSGPAKKKLPFSMMQPAMKPNVIGGRPLMTSSSSKSIKTTSSALSLDEVKENSSPNLMSFEVTDEVFIDDQLEKAISASAAYTVDSSLTQSGFTSFATPSRGSYRRPAAALSTSMANASNTSIREKSMISSTPLVSTKEKLSLNAPLRTGLATPIKPVLRDGHIFQTPLAGNNSRPTPQKPFARPAASSTLDKPIKSRYSLMVTPLPPPSPVRSASAGKSTPSKLTSPKRSETSGSLIKMTPSRSSGAIQPSPMKSGLSKPTPVKAYVRSEKPASNSARRSMIPSSPMRSSSKIPPQSPMSLSKMTPSRRSVASYQKPPAQNVAKVAKSLYGVTTPQAAPKLAPMRTPSIGVPSGEKKLVTPLRTPLIAKPPIGDRNTGSKLHLLRQGPVLRSKMSLSSQQTQVSAMSTSTPGVGPSSDGAKRLIPTSNASATLNGNSSKIPAMQLK